MSSQTIPNSATTELREKYLAQVQRKQIYNAILLAVFVALLVGGFMTANDRNAGGFWDGLPNIFDFPNEMLADASEKIVQFPDHFLHFLPSLLETINIAGAATLIGAIFAVFISLLATRGLAKWPRLIPVFRRSMDILRAMPEIVIALVLIFIMGGGPVPAMIAIALHTVGALGKLFSEVNENADIKSVEGLQSVGATWFQRMWLGIIPQVIPNYLSYALLRFEINIRASAILGFVGSGGIGYELKNAMSWGKGRYDEAAVIFILLFLTIVFVDQVSSYARNKLVGESR
ncbi:phosphonate ABC transporter, permease protein PhnE [Lentilitoribacter sp. Alg239-R112]|jgi:phosphonate transport system permease protein|uniref:phosphonate ABC transporter, permease protein PhnE n=1 Tax=Lentilitoribacter sp. Alg239-R112 TaxID=2305987 RepID=UPI0013A69ADA|nr:phosphonate ABC transporter, permease protein PhnE [Lentilitoribacter sp. Alg239-R112]